MSAVLKFCAEPVIDAFAVENMTTQWDLSHWHTLLELFKTNDAFGLHELIYSLIIGFLLD